MTHGNRRWIKWLLSGAAFTAAVTSTGCGMLGGGYSARNTPPAPIPVIDPPPLPDPAKPAIAEAEPAAPGIADLLADVTEPTTQPTVSAPTLNVFGEMDGKAFASRPAGEVNFQQHTWADEGADSDASIDPTGQRIVFSSTRNSEHANIYVQRVDGQSVVQLTNDNADDAYPVFSRDGSHIAFCSTRGGNWDIYVMDVDGRHAVQVTNSRNQEIHPSFSPDGSHLVYSALGSRSRQWELWTVNLANGEKRMIGYGLFPMWSPNGEKNQIAYQKARARGSRWFSLWTLDLVDGEARTVTEVAVSGNAAIVSPCWSPDGTKLSFATIVEPAKASNGRPSGQQDIWTINADGTNRHRVTDGNGVCASPFWASDNRIYFASNRSGHDCIWSARIEDAASAAAETDTSELKN